MSTPVDEKDEPRFEHPGVPARSSIEEKTVVGEPLSKQEKHGINTHSNDPYRLRLHTTMDNETYSNIQSASQTREQASRLDDDLRLLQIERQISRADHEVERTRSASARRHEEPVDDFDVATNPIHERAAAYEPPAHPATKLAAFFLRVHKSSFLVRYFIYISPIVLIILIPLLLGALLFPRASVGGVYLYWFCTWLEIVWLTLWAGRLLAKALPVPMGLVGSVFTNNAKKWRDMGKQLELPATIFFWWLAIEISFLPTMKNHHIDGDKAARQWETTLNKVLISCFVGAVLNFAEKILIQIITMNFHTRTYQDRIELNKFQIGSLTKLYIYSRAQLAMDDSDFEGPSGPGSGARTPGQLLEKAQKNTRKAFNKFGDVTGKIAGDFTGRAVTTSNHPSQVVLALLRSTTGSQVLARRLYRTFCRDTAECVDIEDLKPAFDNGDEADAAFSMFDKDMNGDISMEELEAVCVEIGRERKSITAALKDLDSVVSKLGSVFMFIVLVIVILVLISLISTSASGVLTSLGSTVLALSWLFSATAQEFLQSCIFVFVKHPFDVGDRVTIYGNTGANMKGDDYFVKEISLLYTEFKKMEGHVVQAPNSYLNTLFILNQRRSGGLAEAVPVTFKFGTTLEQIDALRQKLLEFVTTEKREYQSNILTELRDVVEAHAINLNVIFFFKSNWQNELLRLQRRNKFICALMIAMQEVGIEGPRMRFPGQKESFPLYMQNLPYASEKAGLGGTPDYPTGIPLADLKEQEEPEEDRSPNPFPSSATTGRPRNASISSRADWNHSIMRQRSNTGTTTTRPRGESIAAMGKRIDFSMGAQALSSGDYTGDVYEDRERDATRAATLIPVSINVTEPSQSRGRRGSTVSHTALGRTTSRDTVSGAGGGWSLRRAGTMDSALRKQPSSVHRNRFLPSRRSHDEPPMNFDERMESGMAGIPEVKTGENTPRGGTAGAAGTPSGALGARIDPRSGLVRPQAIRLSTDESIAPEVSGNGQSLFSASPNGRGPMAAAGKARMGSVH